MILSLLVLAFKTLKSSSKISKYLEQKLIYFRYKEEKAKINIEKLRKLLHSNEFGRQLFKSHSISSQRTRPISINFGSVFAKQI